MERLCPSCIKTGECEFRKIVDSIAQEVKRFEDPAQQLNEAFIAHQFIAREREEARRHMCPNLNNIDPDYPGKKLL